MLSGREVISRWNEDWRERLLSVPFCSDAHVRDTYELLETVPVEEPDLYEVWFSAISSLPHRRGRGAVKQVVSREFLEDGPYAARAVYDLAMKEALGQCPYLRQHLGGS